MKLAGWNISGFLYWSKGEVGCSEFRVVLPEEGVIPQHFGQLLVEWRVEIPQDLLGDGQHRSQVFVSRPPGVWRWTSCDLWLYFFCQRPCKTRTHFSHIFRTFSPSFWAISDFTATQNTWNKILWKTEMAICVSGATSRRFDALGGNLGWCWQLFEELSLSFGEIKLQDELIRQK